MILPRDDVEALVPDAHMSKLLYDLSVVTEEHWVIICHLESALRAEEEMYTKKSKGPAQAGTGWGLERWAKMPWKCPHKLHNHHHHHHRTTHADLNESDNFSEAHSSIKTNDENKSTISNDQHITNTSIGRKKSTHNTTHNRRSSAANKAKAVAAAAAAQEEPPTKKKISKEQHTQMMATELHYEGMALENAGRSVGIPRTGDLVAIMSDLKAGKKPKPRSTPTHTTSTSSSYGSRHTSHHTTLHATPHTTPATSNIEEHVTYTHTNHEHDDHDDYDDSALDMFESNDNKHIGDDHDRKSPTKRRENDSRGYATNQNNRKNKIGTTKKQIAKLEVSE